MSAAHIFIVSTAIGAVLFTIVPTIFAAERNALERRTKFIIYDNKYEIINAPKFDINIANDANRNGYGYGTRVAKEEVLLRVLFVKCRVITFNEKIWMLLFFRPKMKKMLATTRTKEENASHAENSW